MALNVIDPAAAAEAPLIIPSALPPQYQPAISLTPLVADEGVIHRLLKELLRRGGLSIGEAARQLGTSSNAISQYINGRRCRPSLLWFLKLCHLCGARVVVEFPRK